MTSITLRRPLFRLLEPWRTRVLWASLGLNLFALPLLAGPYLWHARPSGPPSFDMLVERMARGLPQADAERFRVSMARERPWYDIGRRDMEEKRNAVALAVAHEPYDAAAVRAALVAMQGGLREASGRFDDSLVLALGELSPAGRAELAQSLRRRRP